MNDVASAVCDINIQVNKLNRIIRTGYNTDIQEINNTADAIETFLKDIRDWAHTRAQTPNHQGTVV